ncbi:MAG: hypothetical protein ACSHYB_00330 [Roseibacillus sp.]
MSTEQDSSFPKPEEKSGLNVKRKFIATILIFALVSVTYRLLIGSDYGKSSALYVGIPALLAIGLSLIPTPRTVTGAILLYITLSMLAASVLVLEGLICILVSLPFFLAIGFIIGIFIDRARARENLAKTRLSLIAVFSVFSLEGTHDNLSFKRQEQVTINKTVPLSPQEFQTRLDRGPVFDTSTLPIFLRAGFPLPLASTGGGSLKTGTQWTIPFDHGEKTPRNLTVEIAKSTPNSLTFIPVQDETEIDQWITWQRITWRWHETPTGSTTINLTFEYYRNLDPALYFAPIQRFGVRQAGRYFLDSIIQP